MISARMRRIQEQFTRDCMHAFLCCGMKYVEITQCARSIVPSWHTVPTLQMKLQPDPCLDTGIKIMIECHDNGVHHDGFTQKHSFWEWEDSRLSFYS